MVRWALMIVKTFPVGSFQCNCTVLGDEKTGEAIVIDPGDEPEKILALLASLNLKAKYLLHTHAHIDHIGGTRLVKEKNGGTIGLHKDDLFLYENIKMQGEFLGIFPQKETLPVDHYLIHGDVIEWGENRIEVFHTPGHTPGSLCFRHQSATQDLLFSGDTLFMNSIGRTDLWGGDYDQIISSIKTTLLALPETTSVICGHGPNTTIGREKKRNPFLS